MVTRRRRRGSVPRSLAYGALLIAASACTIPENPLAPGAPLVVVHAVLDPSTLVQRIQLTHSSYGSVNPDGIPNAIVTITVRGVVMTAVPNDAYGQYILNMASYLQLSQFRDGVLTFLAPGDSCTLHVHTAAGEDVVGSMTIPDVLPRGWQASESFNAVQDTLRLDWQPVPGAASYEVRINRDEDANAPYAATPLYLGFRSGPVSIAGTAHQSSPDSPVDDRDVFNSGRTLRVIVSAVDRNYYDYYRAQADPFVGAPPSRLVGGVGVFGSTVPIVRRILKVK